MRRTRPGRPVPSWAAVAVTLVLGVVTAACGGGGDGDGRARRSTSSSSSVPPTVTLPDGPAAQSDVEFGLTMISLSDTYARFGHDLCTLATARLEDLPAPSTAAQVQWAANLSRTWHQRLADALPHLDVALGDTEMAIYELAIEGDWAPEVWNGERARELRREPAYLAALAELDAHEAANCTRAALGISPSTTIPGPGPGS